MIWKPFAKRSLALLVGAAVIPTTSHAALFTVETNLDTVVDDGACSLREAIRNSETNTQEASTDCPAGDATETDTITFDPALNGGRLALTFSPGTFGDLAINEDEAGPLIIRGNGPDNTMLDGDDASVVFDISGPGSSEPPRVITIENLSIINGFESSSDGPGGVDLFGNLDFTIQDVLFRNNSGEDGGGAMRVQGRDTSVARIRRCKFIDNLDARGSGGALTIDSDGLVLVEDSIFRGNESRDVDRARGGALFVRAGSGTSQVVIRRTEFSDNAAIATSTNPDDEPEALGGAIFYNRGGGTDIALELTNLTVSGNRAIANNGAALGGGIANDGETMRLNNVTITENSATAAPGMPAIGGLYAETTDETFLQNTLIAGNSGATAPDCGIVESFANPIRSISPGYNLLGDNTGCDFDAASQDQVGDVQAGEAPIDPGLGPLALNGNTANDTQTHALLAGSPAIDAGDPNSPGPGGPGTCASEDQRGVARPLDGNGDGGAACDIGAFEAGAGTGTPGGDDPPGNGGGGEEPPGDDGGGDDASGDDGSGAAGPALYVLFLLAALVVLIRRGLTRPGGVGNRNEFPRRYLRSTG